MNLSMSSWNQQVVHVVIYIIIYIYMEHAGSISGIGIIMDIRGWDP
jgi:hypothetical protein